jgi:sigma-B regulation protein RsbU (phosphoserine phosphatase)
MASRRVAEPPLPAHRRQASNPLTLPPPEPQRTTRDLLLRSWPGRLFIVAAAIRLVVAILRLFGELPAFFQVLATTATIALAVVLGYFVARLFVLLRRRLLWRVRRKLILSYIFIGVVPALLIVGFFLLGATVISWNVSAYLFKDGYDEIVDDAAAMAEAGAAEISRTPSGAAATISRLQQNGSTALNHPNLSIVFVPQAGGAGTFTRAGAWEHVRPPEAIPGWVKASTPGFTGSVAIPHPDHPGRTELIARAVRAAATAKGMIGHVVADIPIDDQSIDALHEQTGVKAGSVKISSEGEPAESVSALARPDETEPTGSSYFGRSVAFFDVRDWDTGAPRRATVSMTYRLGELYKRIAEAQAVQLEMGESLSDALLLALVFIAGLFLIIEIAALTMGLTLARSITSSIHELFMGTERVRQGDFTHRIEIHTKDQLGELADSFNQMTGSIENLLQTAAEKKRLEEELRIARQIQMSLLPRGPLEMPGLSVTALCVPAREVGGDYYDFFPLGDERLGVLIADVSGKGTSAALYMAELKGLVLSLSQIYQSPRQLLMEVNRIISENLDTRSFITMTYAVLDLARGVMTFARAGHTPLIYLPGSGSVPQDAQILTPSGMVVGLRIDGAEKKFAELLEEEQIMIQPGDCIVLFTDGITEAMNHANDLFGEARLSRIVQEHGHLASGELRERILREIEAFVGGADQHDDMTMILIKVEQAEAARVAV